MGMSVFENLKSMVGMDESSETFRYECQDCDLVFDSETVSRASAACPECGSDTVYSTPNKPLSA